ncbi:hypothetical protein ACKI1S_48295, partial [Streptomyces galilaeus]
MNPMPRHRRLLAAVMLVLALFLQLALVQVARAQTFPALTGRVVDDAHLLSPDQAAALDAKLAALEA